MIQILFDGVEQCRRNLRDFGDDFETFYLLYFYTEVGLMHINKIQIDGNQ
jgi:hypothetical protein